jgi:hypothetical protein
MNSTVSVPIVVEGDIWGFMVGAARPAQPTPDGTDERLARFTELVAAAVANSQARAGRERAPRGLREHPDGPDR